MFRQFLKLYHHYSVDAIVHVWGDVLCVWVITSWRPS